jgi:hypothetical protein
VPEKSKTQMSRIVVSKNRKNTVNNLGKYRLMMKNQGLIAKAKRIMNGPPNRYQDVEDNNSKKNTISFIDKNFMKRSLW